VAECWKHLALVDALCQEDPGHDGHGKLQGNKHADGGEAQDEPRQQGRGGGCNTVHVHCWQSEVPCPHPAGLSLRGWVREPFPRATD
jgi:hypothetical protein